MIRLSGPGGLWALMLLVSGAALAQLNPDNPSDPAADVPTIPSPADSLPAFKTDSMLSEPFRQLEAGGQPAKEAPPPTKASRDSVKSKLHGRHASLSVYVGVGFIDLDGKAVFSAALAEQVRQDSLRVLQDYEPVHMAFPGGIQAVLPVGKYFDLVAKTHSYWYSQEAILGDSLSRRTGDEFYTVQANLAGPGLRYYLPPDLLSVNGSLAMYVQGVYYWQVGGAEISTGHGSAPARFDPAGSGYEITVGFLKEVAGPWSLAGSLGLMQQDFSSDVRWTEILPVGAPPGTVAWGGSSLQAALHLTYNFGVKPPAPAEPAGTPGAPGPSQPPVPAPAGTSP